MASFDISPGDGVTTHFPITFNYLDRAHVVVEIDGVPTSDFTWFDSATIEFNTAPDNGALVYRRRVTPVDEPLTVYANGSVLVEGDMNVATLQSLFAAEEAKDRAGQSITISTVTNQYDFAGHRATNLADPVGEQDAATKSWAESLYATIVTTITAAKNVAIMARDTALDYMNATYGYMMTTLGYRDATAVSAANAYASELNAAQSEANAAAIAESLHPENLLAKANNLSDLDDVAEARDNLGLGTAATKDVGTAANNVVQLDGTGKLPAVDASQVAGLAVVAKSGSYNDLSDKPTIPAAPTDRVTQLRLAYAGYGMKTTGVGASPPPDQGDSYSGAVVTGITQYTDGSSYAQIGARYRYLQYYTPAAGWVTSAFA